MLGAVRMYTDLAPWFHLLTHPSDYREEAEFVTRVVDELVDGPAETLLELGSGGGNNASHLKERFTCTLTDLSPQMLELSATVNPECEHLVGDMRELRLRRTFDAVFVHDAIEYMTTEEDLRRAVLTAYVHCRPGGVAVLVPDHVAENFEPQTEHGGNDAPDGRAVRYLSWSLDPDPNDTTTRTDYAFLLRATDGTVSVAHDTHELGLFPRELWLRVIAEAGFTARVVAEVTSEDRLPREFFVGFRPTD